MLIERLMKMNGASCSCGKVHTFGSEIVSGKGVLGRVPEIIDRFGAEKPYIIADKNTFTAAGEALCALLDEAKIAYSLYCYDEDRPEPDERTVGSALMNMKQGCDMIIAVGSGVINDTAKIISARTKLPYIIVATAPSMDGYASMTSSVTMGGIKVSLPSRCADVIIGDTDVIRSAPRELLLSGVGDMLAKYISICEWRIASLIVGEYYCEEIAELVRDALRCTVDAADRALAGDEEAISTVFDALIIGSVAMNYAGISRPASGVEHYISHLYDTRGVELGDPVSTHGIQCAIATLVAVRLYERLCTITPNAERASAFVRDFDLDAYNEGLAALLGKSANSLIALERSEGKYDRQKHSERLPKIIEKWDDILKIVGEEVPSAANLEAFMKRIGMPTDFDSVGMRGDLLPEIFRASKDIRDKYVLPRLLFDLGVLDEFVADIEADV